MRHTTMYTQSLVKGKKNRAFIFGYECPDEAKYVILGSLVAVWVAAIVLMITCICCGCNGYGQYDEVNGLNEFRKQKELAMSKKDKEDDEMGLMEDDAKME